MHFSPEQKSFGDEKSTERIYIFIRRSSERSCTTSLCFNHTSIVSVCIFVHIICMWAPMYRAQMQRGGRVCRCVCWRRAHSWQSSFIVVCRYVFYYFPGNVYFAPSFARGVIPPNDINFQLLRLTSSACSPQRDIKSILQARLYSCKIPSKLGSCRTLICQDTTANMRLAKSPTFQITSLVNISWCLE